MCRSWFCGLCGVGCKDENGFKCHLESEKHITNESTVATSKKRGRMYVDDFSKVDSAVNLQHC